jgi:LUD domain
MTATATPVTPTAPAIIQLPIDESYAVLPDEATIERAAAALRSHGIEVDVVDDAAAARELVLSRIPDGAEVYQGASVTLADIGVTAEIETSGRYTAIRPITRAMDRQTQGREIRKLSSAPDIMVNSVQAITEDGRLVAASFGGSQLGPLVSGAGKVIIVAGAQKIVPDLATAFQRIEAYSYPIEDARLQVAYHGYRSAINKIVVVNAEMGSRISVIIVRELVGN